MLFLFIIIIIKTKSELIKGVRACWDFFYFFQHCQKHPLLNVIPKSIGIFKINIYLKKKES